MLASRGVIVANGVMLNPSKVYRVTVNNFIQSGGDGFTVLAGGTSVLGGGGRILMRWWVIWGNSRRRGRHMSR